MKFLFSIVDWYALAPGLDQKSAWLKWAQDEQALIQADAILPKCKHLPMMQARRLMLGCRYAVECGLELLKKNTDIDAVVFSNRHSELERNYNILQALVQNMDVSPTDFAMSVHNAAAGTLSIIEKKYIPMSAISAGEDSFLQAFFEVHSLFNKGYHRVLLLDFEGRIPDYYKKILHENDVHQPYAISLVLEKGEGWQCCLEQLQSLSHNKQMRLPKSIMFLHALLSNKQNFKILGLNQNWYWKRTESY